MSQFDLISCDTRLLPIYPVAPVISTFLFDKEGKNVIDHIPYKRGRVAVIPSTTPHAGQFPTKHNSRLVINSIVQKIVDKNVVEGRDEPGTGDNFFTEKKIKLYK